MLESSVDRAGERGEGRGVKAKQAVPDYLQARVDEGMSPLTVAQERTTLQHFADFMGWRKLSTVRVSDLNEFLRYRAEKALETGKVRGDVVTFGTRSLWKVHLRNFFSYAEANDWVDKDPTRRWTNRAVTLPVRDRLERKAFSKDEAHQLIEVALNPRDRAYLVLGLYAGLRRSELDGLRWKHVDLSYEGRSITIPSELAKRARARTVPMLPIVHENLKEWAAIGPQGDWFVVCYEHQDFEPFVKRSGFAFLDASYCPEYPAVTMDRVLARYVREIGLDPKDYSPHSMRHTFLTLIRDAGWPIWEIQHVAGHSSVKTTEKYFHVDVDSIRKRARETVL